MSDDISLNQIKDEIERLSPGISESDPEGFEIAVILLSAALRTGPYLAALRGFTGIRMNLIQAVSKRARANGIWVRDEKGHGSHTECDWFEESGGVSFWLDVAVARGWLAKNESAA